ncbi:BTB/POZ domain and BTB/POZ fold domain and BTB/POZ domain-containing protein, partial [Trichostrongylus colubriformis]
RNRFAVFATPRPRTPVEGPAGPSIDVTIDFTRPDGQRTRPLLVENKRLYVDEHYISVWSPVLRAWCVECPDRELILANVQYDHVVEMLECIHPTYKSVDDQSVHILLPLAYDYQMDGLLHRCECFLVTHNLPFLEKVWIADRYKLNRLLILCLREMRPNSKVDLTGSRYYALSDRVKVLLLERLHGAPAPEEIAEPPLDLEMFQRQSDLFFSAIRAKTGRVYHVNPYYMAAWSNVFQERVYCSSSSVEEIFCPCSHEELKAFLMAIHPPQLRLNEQNIGPVLMAACKMESPALLKKCALMLLAQQTQLSVFVRLSLLDRCFLHEMIPQCLLMVHRPEHLIQMTQQSTYDCLSTRARAAMLDRLAVLLDEPGMQPHHCSRCKATSTCQSVTWMCPQCKTYSTDPNLLRHPQNPQQPPAR